MPKSITGDERERLLVQLGGVLDEARRLRRTLTYLQLADALAIEAPQRIHKTTRLLEILLKRDAEAGRPLRAALAVSRVGDGRPAAGFFDRARRLGLFDGQDSDAFHQRLMDDLFATSSSADDRTFN
jgi:hypothetical protein